MEFKLHYMIGNHESADKYKVKLYERADF